MQHVALIYRAYFLWFEPLIALLGALGATFLDAKPVLVGITPISMLAAASAPITPFTRALLDQLCAFWFLVAFNQAVILRVTQDLRVWKALLLGMALCDAAHICSLVSTDMDAFVNVTAWRGSDWLNNGTLFAGLILRTMFLLGAPLRDSKDKRS